MSPTLCSRHLHHSISLEVNLEALPQHQQAPLTLHRAIQQVQLPQAALILEEELVHPPLHPLNLLYLAILQPLLLRLRQTLPLTSIHPIPLHPHCPALDRKQPEQHLPLSNDMPQRSTH